MVPKSIMAWWCWYCMTQQQQPSPPNRKYSALPASREPEIEPPDTACEPQARPLPTRSSRRPRGSCPRMQIDILSAGRAALQV